MLCRTSLLFDSTLAGLMDSGQDTGEKLKLGAEKRFPGECCILADGCKGMLRPRNILIPYGHWPRMTSPQAAIRVGEIRFFQ